MLQVIRQIWPLILGILFLTVGNGIQGTLLGVRGATEGFTAGTMSLVIAGFFVGFLGGSKLTPSLIKRVGHVRVFAALGSLISAVMVLYAAFAHPWVWFLLRIIIGFCFSGVYVVAESWLNDGATNESRGKVLSLYIITQMLGIVSAQALMNFGDPEGYFLFVIASVLVSISFAPILLSVSPVPVFETAAPMTTRELINISPLGAFGSFCLGAIFAGMWGMGAVYGTEAGLSVREISIFVATIYVGGMFAQYPIGWLSDRMDRRFLILTASCACALTTIFAVFFAGNFYFLLIVSFIMGGLINPLYSLIIAYTNDYLDHKDMASAAGGIIFIHGIGAIGGPLLIGWMMVVFGPEGFFIYMFAVTGVLAGFAAVRMILRPVSTEGTTMSYTPVSATSSPVAVDMAQEHAIDLQRDLDAE